MFRPPHLDRSASSSGERLEPGYDAFGSLELTSCCHISHIILPLGHCNNASAARQQVAVSGLRLAVSYMNV